MYSSKISRYSYSCHAFFFSLLTLESCRLRRSGRSESKRPRCFGSSLSRPLTCWATAGFPNAGRSVAGKTGVKENFPAALFELSALCAWLLTPGMPASPPLLLQRWLKSRLTHDSARSSAALIPTEMVCLCLLAACSMYCLVRLPSDCDSQIVQATG